MNSATEIDLLAACILVNEMLAATPGDVSLPLEVRTKAVDAHASLLGLEVALRKEQIARMS